MKIIEINKRKFIDQELFDYIQNIFNTFNGNNITQNSTIFFCKNTTVNKIVTDYSTFDINRTLKFDKADYVILDRINILNFPQFFDGNTLTENSNDQVVYGIYNCSIENQDTIELIEYIANNNLPIIFINQNKLNEDLNNGFVINRENYHTIKQLINSESEDNKKLGVSMLINSNLKENLYWIIYLLFNKENLLDAYDKNRIIKKYLVEVILDYRVSTYLKNKNTAMSIVKNSEVLEFFIQDIKQEFMDNIDTYFNNLGINNFILEDFKIKYNG